MIRTLRLVCLLALTSPLIAQQPAHPAPASASARPAITGVAFAAYYTTDPTAAQKFYSKTLGFARIEDGSVWRYPVNRSQWIEIITTPPPHPNDRYASIGFTTRDAAQLERYLRARGVTIDSPLKDGRFAVHDPEGDRIVFVQAGSQKDVAAAPPSPNATSQRIIHAGVITHDLAKESAFWQDILGFHPYWRGGHNDTSVDWVMYQVPSGSDWIELMLNPAPSPTLQQAGVMYHLSLGEYTIQDAITMLARNGCEGAACSKTLTGRDGKVQLTQFDPDHTRVEFMEFKPVQTPCCTPVTGETPTMDEDQ